MDASFETAYVGSSNRATVKQVSMIGPRSDVVALGSDSGHACFWDTWTGKLVHKVKADSQIVNCIAQSPWDSDVATSGIDNTIKILSPLLDRSDEHEESRQLSIPSESESVEENDSWLDLDDDDALILSRIMETQHDWYAEDEGDTDEDSDI